jgi:aminoglycoside/choline kinase family phosphotransferase
LDFSPLEGRGSDRAFFRIRWNRKDTAILVHYDPKRVENTYYAAIAEFLRENDIPTPRLIRHAPAACLILMEDLGDTDLWSLRKTSWENRRPLYQKTLAIARRIHSLPEKGFPSSRVRLMESFGPDLYRWERDYFREHFVRNFCGIELEASLERQLESELSALGERLSGSMRCLVHRDLQSQNVMIRDGEPFLIDFQGMRFGSPFYDLGSLLCDPYVNISGSERDKLLSYYYGLTKWDYDWAAFREAFWEASAQRLMQALGAYGFLGFKKGLKAYLEHIPSGLHNLYLAASHAASLPRLRELSKKCGRTIR